MLKIVLILYSIVIQCNQGGERNEKQANFNSINRGRSSKAGPNSKRRRKNPFICNKSDNQGSYMEKNKLKSLKVKWEAPTQLELIEKQAEALGRSMCIADEIIEKILEIANEATKKIKTYTEMLHLEFDDFKDKYLI